MARNVHTNFVDCVACHPCDKEIFATGSRDTTILVWKVDFKNSGSQCIFQYVGHQHWVISLDWLQHGYTLLSSSKSSAIHVWRVPFEQDLCQAIQSNESVIGIPLEMSSERIEECSVPDKTEYISLKQDLSVGGSFLSVDAETHDEFSEFDGVRMFIEREEKEITQPSITFNSSAMPSGSGASTR
jgi:WD40 repeat protein